MASAAPEGHRLAYGAVPAEAPTPGRPRGRVRWDTAHRAVAAGDPIGAVSWQGNPEGDTSPAGSANDRAHPITVTKLSTHLRPECPPETSEGWDTAVMFDATAPGPGYTLTWPRDIFRSELHALFPTINRDVDPVLNLFEEAFDTDEPKEDLEAVARVRGPSPFDDDPPYPQYARVDTFLNAILQNIGKLPEHTDPQPYYYERHSRPIDTRSSDPATSDRAVRVSWTKLVTSLFQRGYLDRTAPRICVDDRFDRDDPNIVLNDKLNSLLNVHAELWPIPTAPDWQVDLFYAVIEAIGDLMARPRERSFHTWDSCGYHYSRFAVQTGRAVYRFEVNKILDRESVGLRLASTGEDAGRLVRVASSSLDELVNRTLVESRSVVKDEVAHAIALFRARSAGASERRSATVVLAGVLEQRRRLLKEELLRKDESALFQIANGFALRHRRDDQRSDYDPIFLDWIFWWYLAVACHEVVTSGFGGAG